MLFGIFSRFRTGGAKEILDYGCGQGYFLGECLRKGLDAWGVDISSFAKKKAEPFLKDRILLLNEKLKEFFSGKDFDVITLWDVIEHCENPVEILRQIKSCLKSKGTLIISTPNVRSSWAKLLGQEWHGFAIPQYHITYFDKSTLKNTLQKAGYKGAMIYTTNPIGRNFLFLSKNLAVGLTRKFLKKDHKFLFAIIGAAAVIPNKILEVVAPLVGLGDTLLAVARND